MALARTSFLFAAAAALLVSTGCAAPVIHLTWSRPPLLPITSSQKVAVDITKDSAVVTPTGAMGAVLGLTKGQVMNASMSVDALRTELAGQLQNMGFAVVDKSRADVIIRVIPTAWEYQLDTSSFPPTS